MRALVVLAVFILMAPSFIPSAQGWLWPILGFHNPCIGYPLQGYRPLPGTPQWPCYPDGGRAQIVLPGSPYCPMCGTLDFGLTPPFGLRPSSLPAANATNETSGEKGTAANTTDEKGRL